MNKKGDKKVAITTSPLTPIEPLKIKTMKDYETIKNLIDHPPKPNERLLELILKHRESKKG